MIEPTGRSLTLAGVNLRGIVEDGSPADATPEGARRELVRRIRRAAPQLTRGAIALIDSPRWPRDLDWSRRGAVMRPGEVSGRVIDRTLRALVEGLRGAGASRLKLAMFPTPRLDYFVQQIAAPACKPHLRAFGRDLFGPGAIGGHAAPPPTGGTFTRFMLAGFAVYRALETRRIACYEGYPDLQFRLWSGREPLPSKASRARALAARQHLIANLAARLGVRGAAVNTLDQADAAILALALLTAAESVDCGIVVEHPAEGRFWLTVPFAAARLLLVRDGWKLGERSER